MLNKGYCYRLQIQPRDLGHSSCVTVLDLLTHRYSHSTRKEWAQRIKNGELQLDGQVVYATMKVKTGQHLVWQRPPWDEPDVPLKFEVCYQDAEILAIHKPSGLPTLPAGGFLEHTLLHQVRYTWSEARPLHRLGRGTSGLVLFGLTRQATSVLSLAWREHRVHKQYLAWVDGLCTQESYEIDISIGPVQHSSLGTVFAANPEGKRAFSRVQVLHRDIERQCSLCKVDIYTGRPHQIRIHLASIGHPLWSDPLYGVGGVPKGELHALPSDLGYLLHSYRLQFEHPKTEEFITLTSRFGLDYKYLGYSS